ncbi:unnamed protein product, partial [Didymodactylos carnosus]
MKTSSGAMGIGKYRDPNEVFPPYKGIRRTDTEYAKVSRIASLEILGQIVI